MDEGHGGCPLFKSEVDKANWNVCHSVLKNYSEDKMEMIAHIYRPGDTISDKIYTLAKSKGVHQDTIWSLVNIIERRIAIKRGLI
jgi:hypothetical protein